MSISRRMDKTVVVHIYNGILLSYLKNSSEPVLMRWMKLETIIQNEVSQKEKHQYSILTHIYGIWKGVVMTLYVRQQKRRRYKEQTFRLWEKVRVG